MDRRNGSGWPGSSTEVDLVRVIAGIVLTATAAPLMLSILMFGRLVVAFPVAPLILTASIIVGLSISSSAAVINAAVVSLLARFRADGLPISIASGGLVGIWALAVMRHRRMGIDLAESTSAREMLPFAATGAAMGALYWLIAIMPQRRRRLMQESRDIDQAAQDAGKRKRDRRIAWDGRAPPY